MSTLIQLDRRRQLCFASLQGKCARSLLPLELAAGASLPAVVYLREGKLLVRSAAERELFLD